MKHSDKYPPGTVEDARNLPPPTKVMGLHPLYWGMIFVFCAAAVGMYSEIVGFYDHVEDAVERKHSDGPDSHKAEDQGKSDGHEDDSSKFKSKKKD